jgi:hypothetical protein
MNREFWQRAVDGWVRTLSAEEISYIQNKVECILQTNSINGLEPDIPTAKDFVFNLDDELDW